MVIEVTLRQVRVEGVSKRHNFSDSLIMMTNYAPYHK
jgi:hypothetical protein